MFKLETERLIFREMTQDDFEPLKEIISDPITMSFYPKPYDDDGVNRWINWNLNNYKDFGFGLYALILKENGKFIGDCGVTIQNIDGKYCPEIGYHLNRKYWRQGYAKEATRAIRDYIFNNTTINTLYSYMVKENTASIRTAMSNGMSFVKEFIDRDGVTDCVYSITRETWEKIK